MNANELHTVSPIDGRYQKKTAVLRDYFSEYSLIRYRVKVEIEYLHALHHAGIPQLSHLSKSDIQSLLYIFTSFNVNDGQKIKDIENVTNHDVKAVEYYIKDKIANIGLSSIKEFVHFGLTSQDINNTAFPLMLRDAMVDVVIPELNGVVNQLEKMSATWKMIPMLARTHGQPASPTTLGKELFVFVERLKGQLEMLEAIPHKAKFGGATGNFNAHKVAYPKIDWPTFGDHFVQNYLGLVRSKTTTQIEHYDTMAAIFHTWMRIGTILIDLCRDLWAYISMEYFRQKTVKNEVGSSAMPHKVNPIDFENAEGNLGMANAIFEHLAAKLPISRLQRDLTDSTVLRNIGVPFGHLIISLASIRKGMDKILLNEEKLRDDLDKNWAVVSEAIQNVLRKIGYPEPYEALKALTRGNQSINRESIHKFIDSLDLSDDIKHSLKEITPFNYTGFTYSN